MAGNKRPSYLKRQKEQQRMARASAKREARRMRKQSKAQQIEGFEDPSLANDMGEDGLDIDATQEDDANDGPEAVENDEELSGGARQT